MSRKRRPRQRMAHWAIASIGTTDAEYAAKNIREALDRLGYEITKKDQN